MRVKRQLEIKGLHKFAEEDTYNEGCDPTSGMSHAVDLDFQADNLEGLIGLVCSALGIEESPDNYELNSCDEPGRIDFTTMETQDGTTATKSELEQWKRGKLRLWYCVYTAQVESVQRRRPFLKGGKNDK